MITAVGDEPKKRNSAYKPYFRDSKIHIGNSIMQEFGADVNNYQVPDAEVSFLPHPAKYLEDASMAMSSKSDKSKGSDSNQPQRMLLNTRLANCTTKAPIGKAFTSPSLSAVSCS